MSWKYRSDAHTLSPWGRGPATCGPWRACWYSTVPAGKPLALCGQEVSREHTGLEQGNRPGSGPTITSGNPACQG